MPLKDTRGLGSALPACFPPERVSYSAGDPVSGHSAYVREWQGQDTVGLTKWAMGRRGVREREPVEQRHVWKLVAALGIAAMVYAWADEERFNLPEFFASGAGAATAGTLFWRDPPKLN